jgi:Na+/melibiose symporter-like transporter
MPLDRLLFYVLPAIPIAALTLPLYIIVPTFYAETLGLSLGAVGGAIIAVRVIDAVTDPVIGWLSDRWRPAFGRRRSFFLVALFPAAVACMMLFWPPVKPSALYPLRRCSSPTRHGVPSSPAVIACARASPAIARPSPSSAR